ncbi:MAG: 4-alpha-glucanotransferase [Candidatus Omnitrophica bacterium]|nr:4-alpha-glucanotransferase [Candidatus Omnitrophota bacterium]
MNKRGSGIFMHITSLPSKYGIGDIGPEAFGFADLLEDTGQSYWQVLPVTRTEREFGNSPYSSVSAFAFNPLLISPELLMEEGLLEDVDTEGAGLLQGKVDYSRVIPFKTKLLDGAYENFRAGKGSLAGVFDEFCREQAYWLDDHCLFTVLKEKFGGAPWNEWPEEFSGRRPEALEKAAKDEEYGIGKEKFLQFIFFRQWKALREYCNGKGIQIVGDLPIYVNYDSADVWSHTQLFKLDENRNMTVVSGVPPDYFSSTGQKWGNPVYDWEALKSSGYRWWLRRLKHTFDTFDMVRIDHFRGLVAYWEIPADAETGEHGKWVDVPVRDLFNAVFKRFPCLPVVAEDLGYITPDVREVVRDFRLPGMKVLIFAFGEEDPTHPYLPHTYGRNYVAYTGVHDTNTARGWFEQEAGEAARERLCRYAGRRVTAEDVHWHMIRMVMGSVADISMIPMQDVLGLGSEARMNFPSSGKNNWEWRMLPGQFCAEARDGLREMVYTYGRA